MGSAACVVRRDRDSGRAARDARRAADRAMARLRDGRHGAVREDGRQRSRQYRYGAVTQRTGGFQRRQRLRGRRRAACFACTADGYATVRCDKFRSWCGAARTGVALILNNLYCGTGCGESARRFRACRRRRMTDGRSRLQRTGFTKTPPCDRRSKTPDAR
ncbi:hypothetical protein EMIT0111MI5_90249 [Burkholderia sp. IT-111MI5]